jgi:hypothetical protein
MSELVELEDRSWGNLPKVEQTQHCFKARNKIKDDHVTNSLWDSIRWCRSTAQKNECNI